MDAINVGDIKQIFYSLDSIMQQNKEILTKLDSELGDGDLGLTMSKGFAEIAKAMKEFEDNDAGKTFMKAGMVMAQAVPSTMGTLVASAFMRAGKAIKGKQELNIEDMAKVLSAFVEGIMQRGKAKPGDKTIIDSLNPAAKALNDALVNKSSLKKGMELAYSAAVDGLEQTKNMVSQHGKAAVFQEKTIGKQDPGATVGMLIIKGFHDYIISRD